MGTKPRERGREGKGGGGREGKGGGGRRQPVRDEPETLDEKRWRKEREAVDKARIARHQAKDAEGKMKWQREWDEDKEVVAARSGGVVGRATAHYVRAEEEV